MSISTVEELLESAAHVALIARTKKAFARTERGNSVNVHEKSACCWCAAGLLEAAAQLAPLPARSLLIGEAHERILLQIGNTHTSISVWNDCYATNEDVFRTLMRAAQ